MNIDWQKFITVDEGWVVDFLSIHKLKNERKLILRTYSVRFKSAKYDTTELVAFVKNSIENYVYNEREKESIRRNGGDVLETAMQYFGEIDPTYDGRFGELILYLLVESVLKIPMLVFKIPLSPNDQVKGSDGIFVGNYKDQPAILIGEAKTWGDLGGALNSAFISLNRFHTEEKKVLKDEYFVANKSLRLDQLTLTREELDYIYDCFYLGSEVNKKREIVHPVLIIYDDNRIDTINKTDPNDSNAELKKLIEDRLNEQFTTLKALCNKFPNVAAVSLDFFFIPLKSVDSFRKELYTAIHKSPPPRSRKPKNIKTA